MIKTIAWLLAWSLSGVVLGAIVVGVGFLTGN